MQKVSKSEYIVLWSQKILDNEEVLVQREQTS